MSDQHDAGPLPELTPEQEADVRRLLVEARHDEPIPTEVAARLDTVLAGLSRDEPGAPGIAPVIDLAARRRRRNAAAVLAGAAAVIVAGFAIGQYINVGSDDNGAGGSAADAPRTAGTDAGGDKAEVASPAAPTRDQASTGAPSNPVPAAQPPPLVLSSQNLEHDLTDQLRDSVSASAGGSDSALSYAPGCTPAAPRSKYGLGDLFPALFDGEPAVVALRPPADGKQQADVLACTTAATLATVSIPATH
jgi:hypothetical protein